VKTAVLSIQEVTKFDQAYVYPQRGLGFAMLLSPTNWTHLSTDASCLQLNLGIVELFSQALFSAF